MSPFIPLSFFLFIISTSHGLNITIPLIHRDSIYSPLYNATETIEDRAQRVMKASLERVAKASLDRYEHLSSALSIRPEANLVPGFQNHGFYMNFSIGTPPVPQLSLMDTGSSLLWVKCKPCSPCKHNPKDPPIFDPDNSETNFQVPCQEKCQKCTKKDWTPLSHRKCKFTQHYVGRRVSEGIYAEDRITFQTSIDDRTNITLKNFLFGCSSYLTNRGNDIDKHFSGVIGLGTSNPTESYFGDRPLIWDLGYKFSYCVGRLSDRSYPYNSISFGKNAKMIGMETPIYTDTDSYYVNLIDISIGNREVFREMSYMYGGMLVNSGAEITYLPNEALDVIKAEVKREARLRGMKQIWTTFKLGPFSLCYRGTVDKDAHGFPPLGFHFEQGGMLTVQGLGLFYQVKNDIFCLAIIGSKNNLGISLVSFRKFGLDG
ncbi:Aspartic proteinase CDR1 [Linum perenne]